ncbi:MAG: DUF1573 domain-containing protein [Planctomycetota bacterium]
MTLAYVEVGTVETALAPPMSEGDELALQGGGEAGLASPGVRGPSADVDSETYNFGTMQRGSTESHEFVFTNGGNAPLTLEVGRTSCKCTLGDVANRPIPPGESSPVRLEWVAKSQPGSFRQVATVLTNDPSKPTIELTVEGIVTETTGLVPNEFLLGRMNADETHTATVYLASYDTSEEADELLAEATMDDSVAMADRYEFTTEPVSRSDLPIEGAETGVKLTVTAGPGLPIGTITEWVTVRTNLHDDRPQGTELDGVTLQVPLLARVEGDISLHGAGWSKERGLLNMGKIASSNGKQAKLRISFKGYHADELQAEVASVDPEWLEVELTEPIQIRPGVRHQPMVVRVPSGQPAQIRSGAGAEGGGVGDGDARIRLTTNHPTASELDVKVRFVIAE